MGEAVINYIVAWGICVSTCVLLHAVSPSIKRMVSRRVERDSRGAPGGQGSPREQKEQ